MCLFSVFDASFEQKTLFFVCSFQTFKIKVIAFEHKSEYSRFSLLTFHKVSLQYVINCFLDSAQQGRYACMIQNEI